MAIILSKDHSVISTEDFTWNPKTATFTAEASDFNDRTWLLEQRVYDDAADLGITLWNRATNGRMRYVLWQTHTDADGDVTHWEYRPLREDIRQNSRASHTKVIIFND